MPITDDGFERWEQDEIYERLVNDFEDQFDSSVETGDLVDKQFDALAQTLYENQERALQAVYQSAYLESATGRELEKLAGRLGLERREAVAATGVIEVFRNDVPTTTYTIPRGSVFQTPGSDPIQFETETSARLAEIDDFEDGNLAEYVGSVADWTVNASDEAVAPAVDGSAIRYDERQFTRGKVFNYDIRLDTDSTLGFQFGIEAVGDDFYEAVVDEYASEIRIDVYEGGSIIDSSTTSVDVPAGTDIHAEVEYGIAGDHALRLYESANRETQIAAVSIQDHTEYVSGYIGFVSRDATANAYVKSYANTHDTANIEAVDGGVDTNISSNTITQAVESLTGVDGQTNPLPTGDSDYGGVNGSAFIQGRERETDAQLRERAFDSSIIGGAATVSAIESALREIEHVDSLTLYVNKSDSTDADGMPPHSFEPALYYNGPDEDIAQALFGTKAIDSTDVGGVHGNEVTYDVQSNVLAGDTETIHWSSIPETSIDIELTLIVDEEYVGDDDIKSAIVNYVGGIDVNGERLGGLNVGDDLYVAVLKDVIVGPSDTGVWEVDSYTIDANGDGTDDTETLANGAEAISVADNEVLVTNARDGSIVINTVSK